MDIKTSIRIINDDQRFFEMLVGELTGYRKSHQDQVVRIIEEIIVSGLADENGYMKPGALDDDILYSLEMDLLDLYSEEALQDKIDRALTVVEARLITIDDIIRSLEIDEAAILGEEVFEIDYVQDSIEQISRSYLEGALGTDEYEGSIERIENSMYNYRFNRDKEEHVLREDLMNELRVAANFGENHANSIAITEMGGIDRGLKRIQAERGGIDHGLYSGIYDDIIRPFCDRQLGLIKTYEEWDEMANDMPEGQFDKPVSVYGGGYYCRHRIVPYDPAWSDGVMNLRHEFT